MPYVIIVYDVKNERVNKVHSFLKGYLYWVQNSVFEGNITDADLEALKTRLKEIIDEDADSIFIYSLATEKNLKKIVLGIEKKEVSLVL